MQNFNNPQIKVAYKSEIFYLNQFPRSFDSLCEMTQQKFNFQDSQQLYFFYTDQDHEMVSIHSTNDIGIVKTMMMQNNQQRLKVLVSKTKYHKIETLSEDNSECFLNRYYKYLAEYMTFPSREFSDIVGKKEKMPCQECLGSKGGNNKQPCHYCNGLGFRPKSSMWKLFESLIESKLKQFLFEPLKIFLNQEDDNEGKRVIEDNSTVGQEKRKKHCPPRMFNRSNDSSKGNKMGSNLFSQESKNYMKPNIHNDRLHSMDYLLIEKLMKNEENRKVIIGMIERMKKKQLYDIQYLSNKSNSKSSTELMRQQKLRLLIDKSNNQYNIKRSTISKLQNFNQETRSQPTQDLLKFNKTPLELFASQEMKNQSLGQSLLGNHKKDFSIEGRLCQSSINPTQMNRSNMDSRKISNILNLKSYKKCEIKFEIKNKDRIEMNSKGELSLSIENKNNFDWPDRMTIHLMDEKMRIIKVGQLSRVESNKTLTRTFEFEDQTSIISGLIVQVKHTEDSLKKKFFSKRIRLDVKKVK